MSQIIHETERLSLRELAPSDAPFILVLLNEPGWIRFIGDRGVRTIEGAAAYIAEGPQAMYKAHGFGLYLVETKVDRTPVGICGLLKRETLEFPDLGFAFLKEASGLGYATESSRAVLEHAWRERGLTQILAITSTGNTASINVLTKLGFTFEENRALKADADPVSVFKVEPS